MLSSIPLFLNLGGSEIALIMFVALLLFGGEKLPGLARGLGKGIRDFKDASEGVKREINNQINSFEEKKEATAITPHIEEDVHVQVADESKPLIDPTPVAGTVAIGEHRSTDIDTVMGDHHAEGHVSTPHPEPVKTTHE